MKDQTKQEQKPARVPYMQPAASGGCGCGSRPAVWPAPPQGAYAHGMPEMPWAYAYHQTPARPQPHSSSHTQSHSQSHPHSSSHTQSHSQSHPHSSPHSHSHSQSHSHPYPHPYPPGPWPLPLPIPIPLPVPAPYPPVPAPYPPAQQPFVTVVINGGAAFPGVTNGYTIGYRPGMTIADALAQTGVVRFGPGGQIAAVGGVPIGGNVGYQLRIGGRIIPSTQIGYPVQPSDTVTLELYRL